MRKEKRKVLIKRVCVRVPGTATAVVSGGGTCDVAYEAERRAVPGC